MTGRTVTIAPVSESSASPESRCDYCGDALPTRATNPQNGQRFCGSRCRKWSSIDRKRARKFGVEIVDGPRWKVFEDANWTCHMCGGAILRQDARDDLAESVDHVVPLDHGGAHAPWNWAAAHRFCNSVRDGVAPEAFMATYGEMVEQRVLRLIGEVCSEG